MRRQDRAVDTNTAFDILTHASYGVLSTVGTEGLPYGVPLSFGVIDHTIYFHCATEGRKIDNLKNNSHVSFCAVGETPTPFFKNSNFSTSYQSAIISGEAYEVTDKAEKINALRAICEKYLSGYMEHFDQSIEKSLIITCVYGIKIESITGKERKQS